jgi:hypothetical protein
MKHLASTLIVLACGLAAGCGVTDSSALLTKGMSAEITAAARDDGTTLVSASLFDGYPEQLIFVDLAEGDQLVATSGGASMTLDKTQLLTIVSYTATFPNGNEGDTFNIDFQRTVDGGAPSSIATLPAAFTLGTVASTASRAQDVTLTWSPSGSADQMAWEATGDCIQTASGSIPADTGTYTIPANTFVVPQGSGNTQCQVSVAVLRKRAGSLDPAFGKGGDIVGEQERAAMFTSTP